MFYNIYIYRKPHCYLYQSILASLWLSISLSDANLPTSLIDISQEFHSDASTIDIR